MSHPELQQEQAYVDHAYECLDRMRATLEGAQDRMATEFAALAIEAWMKRRQKTFLDAERGLCFGRLTLDELARPLYVGRRWVHDDERQVLVVNWQAPAARPFYTATPTDPHGVTLRRRFRTRGRTIVELRVEPQPEELVVRLDGAYIGVPKEDVGRLIEDARRADGVSAVARERFRMALLRRFYED